MSTTIAEFGANQNQPERSSLAFPALRSLLGDDNAEVLAFPSGSVEVATFAGILDQIYSGGTLTVTVVWAPAAATSGDAALQVQFKKATPGTDNIDTVTFGAAKSAIVTVPGSLGVQVATQFTFTNAEAEALVRGDYYRLAFSRLTAGNTMAGDLHLFGITIEE